MVTDPTPSEIEKYEQPVTKAGLGISETTQRLLKGQKHVSAYTENVLAITNELKKLREQKKDIIKEGKGDFLKKTGKIIAKQSDFLKEEFDILKQNVQKCEEIVKDAQDTLLAGKKLSEAEKSGLVSASHSLDKHTAAQVMNLKLAGVYSSEMNETMKKIISKDIEFHRNFKVAEEFVTRLYTNYDLQKLAIKRGRYRALLELFEKEKVLLQQIEDHEKIAETRAEKDLMKELLADVRRKPKPLSVVPEKKGFWARLGFR